MLLAQWSDYGLGLDYDEEREKAAAERNYEDWRKLDDYLG